ncbi:DUF668 domain-containing protein/DUF3475 domain-containing protein [Cephalotus follicularis]|uniref:DUF668 domain-containing protein/DUF3475 domain-containing protein n=1 Tax=Cephalotus follicularis TaxID=3775 RepID=A0A1Q3CD25_CEPFO|nr:DUF668 domain-containing protein/DUF3475 domain-containing protein [Cephalotus follicularis]
MVAESWFRNLWRIPRKHEAGPEKVPIGVLAFEATSLMSKIVYLWHSLSDKQVTRLREEITNSVGIKKLVSEDDDFIVNSICAELMENLGHMAKSVVRLAEKCSDQDLKRFKQVFDVFIKIGADPYRWEFTWKKMEKKVKKMEHFISVNATLYQEMEVLADLEQTVKRVMVNNTEPQTLFDYQKKAAWKQQEVKNLREISLWNRTYDYTILLMARSLFTIFSRIKYVFGLNQTVGVGDSEAKTSDFIYRSHSVSTLLQSSVHPSENGIMRFSSGPLGMFTTKLGPILKAKKNNDFHSGPLGGSVTKSVPGAGKIKKFKFFSGPLGKPTTKSGPISGVNKTSKKMWHTNDRVTANKPPLGPNQFTKVGPFKGCMMALNSSSVTNCHVSPRGVTLGSLNRANDSNADQLPHSNMVHNSPSIFNSECRMLDAPPGTLGAAALALHYANVIIVIEKLVASPHLIGHDARDDLYNLLPASVRTALRERLKPYTKSLASSVYDTVLAGEWTEAMASILEWLAPLAHNMIRWQSERSYEQQSLVSRTNVLLVQTLYFADLDKTEATITELLVGLNYVYRFGRELNAKALQECDSGRIFDECLILDK